MSAIYSQQRISLRSATLFGVVCGVLRELSEQPWLENGDVPRILMLPSINAFTVAMLFFAYCAVIAWHATHHGEQRKISASKLIAYLACVSLAMGISGSVVAWAWAMVIQIVI